MLEKPKYDLKQLVPLLCCEYKWHPIYMVMSVLNDDELRVFRDELRAKWPYQRLHLNLEKEFTARLGDE